ncbi:MAG: DUF6776 family protein [Pseudomonadota bacterium]
MTSVKPSKQYAMAVVPYRPYYRYLVIFGLSLTFLLAVIGSFFAGRYYAVGNKGDILAERDRLRLGYQNTLVEARKLEQQTANLRLAAEVDRKANEEVRAEVVQLKTRVAELEQDNNFYRSLMRPAPGDKGIVVDAPSVELTNTPGVYKYSMAVKQVVTQHRQVSGYLQFSLIGSQAGERQTLALKDISDAVSVDRVRLRFKYFQRLEGEMRLPEGFTPERIVLNVVMQRPTSVVIDKKFGWLVKE